MSSSYVEVRDTENGTEDNTLSFGLETCESNGIDSQTPVEGEAAKDHTYNKDPVEVQGGVEVLVSEEEGESVSTGSEQVEKPKSGRRQKKASSSKSPKKPRVTRSPVKDITKKPASLRKRVPVKEEKPVEKGKGSKRVGKEPSEPIPDPDSTSVEETPEEKPVEVLGKRSRKRKLDNSDVSDTVEVKVIKKEAVKNKNEEKPDVKVQIKEEPKEIKQEEEEEKPEVKEIEVKLETKSPKKEDKQINKRMPKEKAPVFSSEDVPVDDVKLPAGWSRKVVQRKSGKTAGQFDVYIYSPDGKKLRSRPDVASYLSKTNSSLKAEDFSFAVRITTATEPPSTKKIKAPIRKRKSEPSPKKLRVSPAKKKAASISSTKKGPKLVVKLNFTSPKKRILSNYEEQKKTEKRSGANKSKKGKKSTLQKKSTSGTNKQTVGTKKKASRSRTSKKII